MCNGNGHSHKRRPSRLRGQSRFANVTALSATFVWNGHATGIICTPVERRYNNAGASIMLLHHTWKCIILLQRTDNKHNDETGGRVRVYFSSIFNIWLIGQINSTGPWVYMPFMRHINTFRESVAYNGIALIEFYFPADITDYSQPGIF